VVSDGVHPFVNEDMGLAAIFPRGSLVCLGRSGDAARGFYSWQEGRVEGCPERGDLPVTYMGIGTSFNANDHRTVREAVGDCEPLSPEITRRLAGQALAFPAHRSIACQEAREDGMIEIFVHALAGARHDDEPPQIPHIAYFATLGTRPDRLDRDLAMFRTFLRRIRIGIPS
jgi:hypothetical protein